MMPDRPFRPVRREEHQPFGGRRLERILGYRPISRSPVSAVVDHLDAYAPGSRQRAYSATYADATARTPVYVSEGTTAIHVLWTEPGGRAELFAGIDPHGETDLVGHEAQPGDTLSAPVGLPFALGAGVIALIFASGSTRVAIDPVEWSPAPLAQPPHHGLNLFQRFNRRTICAAHRDVLLERWKISHPLDLALNPHQWHYLTNLVEPVALNWPGGSTILDRMESRFLPAGSSGVTIVPDGLGYVMIGTIPDLARDVVAPLRGAGYERSAIAALGVLDAGLD